MTDTEIANDIATDETEALIASNKVEGTAVYDEDGEKLGSIYNFMVDKFSGQVEYAVLQFGGVFGIGSDYYPLPWEKLSYDVDQGGYVVDIDKETLEAAPRYTADEQPVYDQAYGERIYGYYGLNYN
ncbi:PRC-barrel domain-containing protein [Sphingomonas sp. MMS12-HWE2-04]|uniref:PRC-barrel domain-containing protein n=1 Tax=Sphingomonas sp. MMS12-HWE2-04 TaxID=3234199 RepID=UPI00384A84DF